MTGDANITDFEVAVTRDTLPVRVSARGELDIATAAQLEAAAREALSSGPVCLDLSGLSFIDSSGVRAVGRVMATACADGVELSIRPRFHENVRTVLRMTGMLDTLPMSQQPG